MKDWPVEIKSVQVVIYTGPSDGSYVVFEVRDRGRSARRHDLRRRRTLGGAGDSPRSLAAALRVIADHLDAEGQRP